MQGKIKVGLGITKNLGNYESLRIDAGLEANVDNIFNDEDWAKAWDQIDSELEKKLQELEDQTGNAGGKK